MRPLRAASIVAGGAMLGAALLLTATPAMAANVDATGCAFVDYRVPVGTTITFTLAAGCNYATPMVHSGSPSFTSAPLYGPGTVVATVNGPEDFATMYFSSGTTAETFVSACDVVTGYDYADPTALYTLADYCSPAQDGPPDVLQQVAAPTETGCVITETSLNWGGSASGGWGRSWASWVNGGSGGGVCTRTLSYRASLGTYVVAGESGALR